ncbi:MAG: S41 family peptidase [Vicinamibacterales bacterium]
MSRYRATSAATAAIIISALAGGILGSRPLATADRLDERTRTFAAALNLLEHNAIYHVESDRLIYSAIGGMLQTLDPHSSFLDPRAYRQMRDRQEGHYYGLGITIQVIDGDITVSALFEGSPAYKKGIRRGDVIARIEGQDAKGWTSDDAVNALRGPKGTTVHVSIRRRGYDQLIEMDVVRDDINIPSIPAAFMVDSTTGYIRLQDFAENTDRDLGIALDELTSRGMKRLVLDLRGNPGGPLEQAIRVANRFLTRNQLIVYTRGRVPNSDKDYVAEQPTAYVGMPLVVLVDRRSASASEIVAGALQDHDRALIVGETTFGKALVQSVYNLEGEAGLALTTARYYTPSGRLIQRPWDGTFDEYLSYSARAQDRKREQPQDQLKHTDAGRKVFGGGGIEPDHHLAGPIEGFDPSPLGRTLYARQVFAGFAERFALAGDTRIAPSASIKSLPRDFTVDEAMLADFKQYARSQKIDIDEAAFAADLEFIRAMIRFELDVALFNVSEARRNLFPKDPQARLAMRLFPEAEKLLSLAQQSARNRDKVR